MSLIETMPDRSQHGVPLEQTNCVLCGSDRSNQEAQGRDTLYGVSNQMFTFVRCADCGHIYLNPRPTIEAIEMIYPPTYSSFTGRFSDSRSVIALIKDRVLLSRLRALRLDLRVDATILDIGCGDGAFLASVRREYPRARLIGIDWHFADSTRRHFDQLQIEWIEGPIESAPLPECEVDLVIMNQLVEHLWEPRAVLLRCQTALRPGGRIALETPNPDGYDRRWWFRSGRWGSYYFPRHLNLFSRGGLAKLVTQSGFEVEKQMNLVAPLCWIYTITAFNRTRRHPLSLIDRFFKDTNPLALSPFAAIDWFAKTCRLATSNQKLLARKPG